MATANQPLDQWRETLEKILQYYADLPYRYGDVNTYVVVSCDAPKGLAVNGSQSFYADARRLGE